ncbi:hypothetical protein H4R18_005257 [Coemansia javaensis]|uniref:G-protein coupled receptors family 3 profile domain-containing protein n=1 Tax=Coemansia javaensis TaxID=2761396 RepID=A0A9W8H6I8_9FUNG|nr:hypothetical protein H4R18_005257 [Coemansia javaensis]
MALIDAASEQRRVEAAALLGLRLDPRSGGDVAVVAVIAAMYGVTLAGVVAMLLWRRYPPIRSKAPAMMAVLFVCSVLWFVGDLQVNGHVPLAGTALTNCRGVGFWVRILLGLCGVCAVVALRPYALHHVFRLGRPPRGLRFYAPLLVYIACVLALGIVAMALPDTASVQYAPGLDLCRMALGFKVTVYAFVWVTCLLIVAVNWRIRSIKSSFNESREMAFGCLLVVGVLLFNTLMQFIRPHYPLQRQYRIATTVLDHVCTTTLWWAVMARPLFNCAFRRRAYLRRWIAALRADGLQREYNVRSDPVPPPPPPPPPPAAPSIVELKFAHDDRWFYAESPLAGRPWPGANCGPRAMAVPPFVALPLPPPPPSPPPPPPPLSRSGSGSTVAASAHHPASWHSPPRSLSVWSDDAHDRHLL